MNGMNECKWSGKGTEQRGKMHYEFQLILSAAVNRAVISLPLSSSCHLPNTRSSSERVYVLASATASGTPVSSEPLS